MGKSYKLDADGVVVEYVPESGDYRPVPAMRLAEAIDYIQQSPRAQMANKGKVAVKITRG